MKNILLDVEPFNRNIRFFSLGVGILQLHCDRPFLSRHERDKVVAKDHRQNPFPAFYPDDFQLDHESRLRGIVDKLGCEMPLGTISHDFCIQLQVSLSEEPGQL